MNTTKAALPTDVIGVSVGAGKVAKWLSGLLSGFRRRRAEKINQLAEVVAQMEVELEEDPSRDHAAFELERFRKQLQQMRSRI